MRNAGALSESGRRGSDELLGALCLRALCGERTGPGAPATPPARRTPRPQALRPARLTARTSSVLRALSGGCI